MPSMSRECATGSPRPEEVCELPVARIWASNRVFRPTRPALARWWRIKVSHLADFCLQNHADLYGWAAYWQTTCLENGG
jgi:hypothetical protein